MLYAVLSCSVLKPYVFLHSMSTPTSFASKTDLSAMEGHVVVMVRVIPTTPACASEQSHFSHSLIAYVMFAHVAHIYIYLLRALMSCTFLQLRIHGSNVLSPASGASLAHFRPP